MKNADLRATGIALLLTAALMGCSSQQAGSQGSPEEQSATVEGAVAQEVTFGNVTVPDRVEGFTLLTSEDVEAIRAAGYECESPSNRSHGPDESYGSIWTEVMFYTSDRGKLVAGADCDDAHAALLEVIVNGFPDEGTTTEKAGQWFLAGEPEFSPGIRCVRVANLLCGGTSGTTNWAVFWLLGSSGDEDQLPELARYADKIIP